MNVSEPDHFENASELVIRQLADELHEARVRLADVESERNAYRELLTLTLAQLESSVETNERLRTAYRMTPAASVERGRAA